jgi:hypothetical protein
VKDGRKDRGNEETRKKEYANSWMTLRKKGDNNNNNIYQRQLSSHPVAVVILYVYKYMKLITNKFTFKSGALHEKHVVATWNFGNHLSIRL